MLSLKERLTEILIDHKIVSEDQLKKALSIQEEKGGRLRIFPRILLVPG